jgi:8-oxo-dGTP diphosphatase
MRADAFKVILASYVIMQKGDKVLLGRRANTGYRDGCYAFPAGHSDGGESAQSAGAREALEEVGVVIAEEDLEFAHVMHRVAEEKDHERVDFFFTTTKWEGEPYIAEPHKCDDLQWFSVNDLPETASPITKRVLQQLREGNVYSHLNFPED